MEENRTHKDLKVWQKSIELVISVYELTKASHAHFVCDCCKKIEDIHVDASSLLTQVQNQMHYTINTTSLVFNGLCSDCSK